MRRLIIRISVCLTCAIPFLGAVSCNKYLNVVPDDGIATLDMAFNLRSTAIRYLATCYSYMPIDGNVISDSAMLTGDEVWDLVGRVTSSWQLTRVPNTYFNIARGFQSASNVYANDWASFYEGIRCCDILKENIVNVPDMTDAEKKQWQAEATFLKAYYHFCLVRKWGPVPVIRESLPIDSDVETVRVFRDNIDDCFDFIIDLLDEAEPDLPEVIESAEQYGRITKVICKALKAKVTVFAASPLFNGNEDESSLVDSRGIRLFPNKSDEDKLTRWKAAVVACKEAIDACENANIKLYDMSRVEFRVTDSLKRTLALRNAFNQRQPALEPIEMVWPNTQYSANGSFLALEQWSMPNFSEYGHSTSGYRFLGVPLKIVDQFYTRNGLPVSNDLDWVGVNTNEIIDSPTDHSFWLCEGYPTIRLNVNREPRFYSYLAFDGGIWYGPNAKFNDVQPVDLPHIECRSGGTHGKAGNETGPVTGYFPKKFYPYQCNVYDSNKFTTYYFPWPIIRLTDLYLLYAEAINEAEGPMGTHSSEMFKYIDAIRSRAGIPDVKTSWDNHSNNPGYYKTQYGMRNIIHRERLIEMCFESQRFWDIRRWKEAPAEYQKGIYGYNITASAPEDYYVRKMIANQSFGLKDYFWPIYNYYLERNPNLVQNLGW